MAVALVEMSTFRHVNVSSMSPCAHNARNTGISRFKTLLKPTRIQRGKERGNCLPSCPLLSIFISHKVIILMNTKMILAAIALSLTLAACAKKEEAAPADTAAPAETAPAPDAATSDPNAAPSDATTPPAETPPASDQPAQPPQQ
jgi:hypothetical protein